MSHFLVREGIKEVSYRHAPTFKKGASHYEGQVGWLVTGRQPRYRVATDI